MSSLFPRRRQDACWRKASANVVSKRQRPRPWREFLVCFGVVVFKVLSLLLRGRCCRIWRAFFVKWVAKPQSFLPLHCSLKNTKRNTESWPEFAMGFGHCICNFNKLWPLWHLYYRSIESKNIYFCTRTSYIPKGGSLGASNAAEGGCWSVWKG